MNFGGHAAVVIVESQRSTRTHSECSQSERSAGVVDPAVCTFSARPDAVPHFARGRLSAVSHGAVAFTHDGAKPSETLHQSFCN